MFLGVRVRVADETGRRHALQIGFPGAATRFDAISQIRLVDETIRAILGDILRAAAHQGDVVWQTGVPHCKIVRKQRILLRQVIQVRHLWIADHTGIA